MAAMPSTYVTARVFESGGTGRKDQKTVIAKITVPATDATVYGAASTDTIPASVFGLTKIEGCSPMVSGADKYILATPKSDGSMLVTFDLLTVTDANRANVTAKVARVDGSNAGYYYVTVWGY